VRLKRAGITFKRQRFYLRKQSVLGGHQRPKGGEENCIRPEGRAVTGGTGAGSRGTKPALRMSIEKT